MIRTIRAAGLAASVLLAMAGETVAQQDRVASFEMAWPTQRPQAVAAQAQAAAEAITGQQVRRRALIAPPTTPRSSSGRLHLSVPEASTLDIVYLPDVAEFRIVDRELAASIAPEREMAQDEAVKLAKAAFDELARRKLVDAQHYNWDKPDVASTWVVVAGLAARAQKGSASNTASPCAARSTASNWPMRACGLPSMQAAVYPGFVSVA